MKRTLLSIALVFASACGTLTESRPPVDAIITLSASTIRVGDSVAFSVTWTNRTAERIELLYPTAHDVRIVHPDGTTETLHAGKPTIGILTPDLVLDGKGTRTWRGHWLANAGRGTYRVEAVRRVGNAPFEPLGPARAFVAE